MTKLLDIIAKVEIQIPFIFVPWLIYFLLWYFCEDADFYFSPFKISDHSDLLETLALEDGY